MPSIWRLTSSSGFRTQVRLEFYNDWLGVLDDEAKHFLLMWIV